MMKFEFKKLPEITDESKMDDLEIHDFFVYGKNMSAQKQDKLVGQEICYYQVVDKPRKGSVVYAPVYDMLEEDIIKGE